MAQFHHSAVSCPKFWLWDELFPDAIGAATTSARMTLMATTIARFTTVFLLFISWLCIHSHLGETGHLPCGFDTRFLSLRRFPQAQVVGWVAGPHLEVR